MAAADAQTTIATFFTAMTAHDADAAAALVVAEVEIVFGSQVFSGPEAVRELALQEHPDLVFETTPVRFEAVGDRIDVTARRVQRWREGGEIADDQSVRFSFLLDSSGLIARVELS